MAMRYAPQATTPETETETDWGVVMMTAQTEECHRDGGRARAAAA